MWRRAQNRLAEFETQTQRDERGAGRGSQARQRGPREPRQAGGRARGGRRDFGRRRPRQARRGAGGGERHERIQPGRRRPSRPAAVQADQQLATQVKDLRADIDAARGEIPGLAARVAKLETGAPTANDADLSALAARLDKIEAALAAPKSETRVAAEKPAAADNAAAIAIIAGAIADRLAAGAPFGTEVAALQRLGVDPAGWRRLQAVADGAPTGSALAASFRRDCAAGSGRGFAGRERRRRSIAFSPICAASSRYMTLGERAGDDPEAIVSRIEASCRRGDIAGALAAFDKLPEAARQAAGDWPVKARARQGRTPPCSRSARRRSGGSRAALAHDIRGRLARGFRRAAGRLKRRRDVSAVDISRRAGARRLGPELAREQPRRRDGDLARGRISGLADAGARRRPGACGRAVDRLGRAAGSFFASPRWSRSPRGRASARRASWRCRAA